MSKPHGSETPIGRPWVLAFALGMSECGHVCRPPAPSANLALALGQPAFSWGDPSIVTNQLTRNTYIEAIRIADGGDLDALRSFARG